MKTPTEKLYLIYNGNLNNPYPDVSPMTLSELGKWIEDSLPDYIENENCCYEDFEILEVKKTKLKIKRNFNIINEN